MWLLGPGPAATAVGQLAAFAGGVHVALAPHHFSESTVYGWLFLIDGAALLLGGGVLMLSGHVRAWRAAGMAAAATALAYLISRTAGLPGLHPEVWDLKGIFTTSLEGIVAITALVAGLVADRTGPAAPSEQDPAWLLALASRTR